MNKLLAAVALLGALMLTGCGSSCPSSLAVQPAAYTVPIRVVGPPAPRPPAPAYRPPPRQSYRGPQNGTQRPGSTTINNYGSTGGSSPWFWLWFMDQNNEQECQR
jgi:hypothetical protein